MGAGLCGIGWVYVLAVLALSVVLIHAVVTDLMERRRDEHRTKPLMDEWTSALLALAAEHRDCTGHSFRAGTAQPESCDICAFMAGQKK